MPAFAAVLAVIAGAAIFASAAIELTHGAGGAAGILAASLRFARYLTTLVAVGIWVFVIVIRPPEMTIEYDGWWLALWAAMSGAVVTVVAVPVQAAYLAGDTWAVFDWATVSGIARSGFGSSVATGVVGLLLLVLALNRMDEVWSVGAGAAGALLALGAFLLTGHSVVTEPRMLGLGANFAHVAAGSVWLGGLIALGLALRRRKRLGDVEGGVKLVTRFSAAAAIALVIVVVAGTALAWVEVRSFGALGTPYGAVLLAKLALVGGVATMGGYANRRLLPAIRRRSERPWGLLTRIIALESAGLVAVLAVTAILVNIVPARVDAGIDTEVLRAARFGSEHTVTVLIEPAREGVNEIHVWANHDRGVLDEVVEGLTIAFVPPDEESWTMMINPAQVGPGHWLHAGPEFDVAGDWQLEISGAVRDQQHTLSMSIPIAGGFEEVH